MRVTFKLRHSNRCGQRTDRLDEVLTGEVVHVHEEHLPLGDQQFVVTVPNWLGGHTVAGRHLLTMNGAPVSATAPERATAETVTAEQLTVLYNERDRAVAERDRLVDELSAIAQAMVTVLQDHEQAETEEPTGNLDLCQDCHHGRYKHRGPQCLATLTIGSGSNQVREECQCPEFK